MKGLYGTYETTMGSNGARRYGVHEAEFTRPSRRLEKSLGSVNSTITNGIKAKRGGDNSEGSLNNGRQIAKNADQEEPNLHTTLTQYSQRDNGDLFSEPDLDTSLTQEQQLNNGDQERCTYLEPANRIMETIRTHPGDYSQRAIDTRRKETPSTKYLEEINQSTKLL